MGKATKKVITRALGRGEIEEMFPGADTRCDCTGCNAGCCNVGCEMIVWPGHFGQRPGVNYVFLNRLPLLRDGLVFDPTVGATIDLDYLRKMTDLTGHRLPEGHTARIVFGTYSEEQKEFRVAVKDPQNALVEIERDPAVIRLAEEDMRGVVPETNPQSIVYENRQLDDYGWKGKIYLIIKLDTVAMKGLAQRYTEELARVLADSAEILERFEAEKDDWKKKILELLPEDWQKDTKTRRIVVGVDDLGLMWEVSPGHWKIFLYVRFDEIGYKKVEAEFVESC